MAHVNYILKPSRLGNKLFLALVDPLFSYNSPVLNRFIYTLRILPSPFAPRLRRQRDE